VLPTVVAVAVVSMTTALAGCTQAGDSQPGPAAPSPGRSTPPATPLGPGTPSADAPPLGLDVRYLDEDGTFKVLRVQDFPR
jgi:hypothetical protein